MYQTNLRSDRAMGGNGLYWDETSATDLPNLSFYQRELDRRMQYLADLGLVNALGQAWFMSIDGDLQHQKNLARYLVARYGALPMVWTLAGETAGYEPGEARRRIDGWREVALLIQKLECDTKSRNVLRVNAALSIWSNPTVTCTGQKPALGSSQDNMGNLPA